MLHCHMLHCHMLHCHMLHCHMLCVTWHGPSHMPPYLSPVTLFVSHFFVTIPVVCYLLCSVPPFSHPPTSLSLIHWIGKPTAKLTDYSFNDLLDTSFTISIWANTILRMLEGVGVWLKHCIFWYPGEAVVLCFYVIKRFEITMFICFSAHVMKKCMAQLSFFLSRNLVNLTEK